MKQIADTPANRQRFPCAFDTASVDGLKELTTLAPRSWPGLLVDRAPRLRLHGGVTIGEVIGTRGDLRALARGVHDVGRLRQARWSAATLRQHFSATRVLEIDLAFAEKVEDWLVGTRGLAPSSARKVVEHLLALRGSIAEAARAPRLDDARLETAWTREPPLTIEQYAALRLELPLKPRVAADLVTTCRLLPATVLGLVFEDVGAGGRTIAVRGRRQRHVLPVPAFLRGDLTAVAEEAGPGQPLFPGRSGAGTFGPAALRKRVQAASTAALGYAVDLRSLGLLAESILGDASGNPVGRLAALRRLAPTWRLIDEPPVSEGAEEPGAAVVGADGQVSELDELRVQIEALQEEVEAGRAERRALGHRADSARSARRALRESGKRLEVRVDRLASIESELAVGVDQAKAALEALNEAITQVNRRTKGDLRAAHQRFATAEAVASLEEQLLRTRTAVFGVGAGVAALGFAWGRELGGDLPNEVQRIIEDVGDRLAALDDS